MKKSIILAGAVAVLAMLTSCQKEEIVPVDEPGAGSDLVFTATIDNPATRTTINTDGASADRGKVSWKSGDEISISDGTNTAVYSVSKISGSSTTFTYKSGGSLAESGVTYTATYGPSSLTSQVYSAAAGDLPMTAISTTTSLHFSVTSGLLKLTLTKSGASVKRIAVSDAANTYILDCWEVQSIEGGKDFFIALPAGTYTKFVINDSEGKVCTINAAGSGLVIVANKIQSLSFEERLSFVAAQTGTAKAKLDGVNEVDVAWVQLWEGGPKWATVNLGVTDPAATTGYGGYYNWGGHTELVSNGYVHDYNTGNADLYGADDTATSLWGEEWRMPTNVEFAGLYEAYLQGKCDITSTSGGVLVTGNRGNYASNSIFLPRAGKFLFYDKVYSAGTLGGYWSSTFRYQNTACCFEIATDGGVQASDGYIYNGLSIRPVLKDECVNFSDAALKSLLVNGDKDSNKYDVNGDGDISLAEAAAVTSLNCSDSEITDLTGLEHCVNLERLVISSNSGITSVNPALFAKLSVLDAGLTGITSLDVSHNPQLSYLSIYGCPCTSLDVSSNPKLETLNVGATSLTSVDVSHNTALKELYIHYTAITSLDLSANTNLENLNLRSTGFTNLDFTNHSALKELDVSHCSSLTSLNVTGCDALESVYLWHSTALTTLTNMKKTACLYVTGYNTAPLQRSIYQVGQLVMPDDDEDKAGSKGVVYVTNDDAERGYTGYEIKIVSIDMGNEIWSSDRNCTDADSWGNGWSNTESIAEISPAAQWCTGHGYGWYFPATYDVYCIFDARETVNITLSAVGGQIIADDAGYWSSYSYNGAEVAHYLVIYEEEIHLMGLEKYNQRNLRAIYRVS